MPEHARPWVSIRSNALRAEIDPHGAQLSKLVQDERELLWDGDPTVWAGRAPILFPIVGELSGGSYRLGSKKYRLPRHGFARGKEFSVIDNTASAVRFRLCADADTRQVYPFDFLFDVAFSIEGASLSVATTVRNLGTVKLPASVGYHPAFRWPLSNEQSRAAHFIAFEVDELQPVRRIGSDGLLLPVPEPTPVSGRKLMLDDALFKNDVLIFDRLQSRSIIYGADSAGPSIRLEFPDAPYLGIWTKPGARFVCIEPWHGITDPQGFDGDFTHKPGITLLAPAEELSFKMRITVLSGRSG